MIDWVECRPIDRNSQSSMRFILESCQKARQWSYEKVIGLAVGGDTGFLRTGAEQVAKDWQDLFVRQNRFMEDVPAYAVESAIEDVVKKGMEVEPETELVYQQFTLKPREGWSKASEAVPQLSWQDYLEGKKKSSSRSLRPEVAVAELFEEGTLNFRWGTVKIIGNYRRKLLAIAQKRRIEQEDFLRKVRFITFRFEGSSLGRYDLWSVGFTFE